MSKVVITEFDVDVNEAFTKALKLIGKIDDLNTKDKNVVVKVGVFDHRKAAHSSVDVVSAIIKGFHKAPKIFLVESDNYRGAGSERLQIWKELFNERVVPFNLSEDTNVKKVKIADEQIDFSHVLFKPNVFVSTHIARKFDRGSILKNLLGLIPDGKKARFHKKLDATLSDACEAIGGIDLAVLDATYLYSGTGVTGKRVKANMLVVGRDAVAVETVGAALVGLNPEKMPTIQEAAKRGLGEGDLEKIEVLGASLDNIKEKFSSAHKKPKEKKSRLKV